jgi:hypothetical protein
VYGGVKILTPVKTTSYNLWGGFAGQLWHNNCLKVVRRNSVDKVESVPKKTFKCGNIWYGSNIGK